jgi:microcystin-dependent protein
MVHELSGRDANSYIANNGGNVGVGTDSPSQAKLDVNGKLRVRTVDSTTSDFQLLSVDNDGVVHKRSASNIVSATGNGVPCGVIAMWSGNINNIPTGWLLCDGSQNTPNLSGKFIAGYKSGDGEYSVGHTDGENRVTLTSQESGTQVHSHEVDQGYTGTSSYSNSTAGADGSHTHNVEITAYRSQEGEQGNAIRRTVNQQQNDANTFDFTTEGAAHKHRIPAHDTQQHKGASASSSHENRPAYYVLAFIIKDGSCLDDNTTVVNETLNQLDDATSFG